MVLILMLIHQIGRTRKHWAIRRNKEHDQLLLLILIIKLEDNLREEVLRFCPLIIIMIINRERRSTSPNWPNKRLYLVKGSDYSKGSTSMFIHGRMYSLDTDVEVICKVWMRARIYLKQILTCEMLGYLDFNIFLCTIKGGAPSKGSCTLTKLLPLTSNHLSTKRAQTN